MATKGDIVNGAYSRIKISGLTSNPTPEDMALGLDVLEDMAAEFETRNICLNFNYTDSPDPSDESGLERGHIGSMKDLLAWRLAPHFGKEITAAIEKLANKAQSLLQSSTARVNRTEAPYRMPRGSGNTKNNHWHRFSYPQPQAPIDCETKNITLGGALDFTYDARLFLGDETITAFTFTASSGLTISNGVNTDGVIGYRVDCSPTARELETVDILITTSTNRKTTARVNYRCTPA